MKPPKSLSDWNLVARYPYHNARGALIMEHRKFEWYDPITGERHKTFRYWNPGMLAAQKPPGADGLLYRLPQVLAAVAAREVIHATEGERDADALVSVGLVATSHHQGAGHFTVAQAAWLADARRVCLWVDKDAAHPEVGAYDAALRYDLLLDVGVSQQRIVLLRAPGPWGVVKDAADMLAAGYSLDDAVRIDPARLAAVAARYTPTSGRRAGYRG